MQSLRKALELAHEALTNAGVDHALIGGMALGGLGVHRATADVDLLIEGEKRNIAKQFLLSAGFVLVQETEEVLHFKGVGFLDLLLARREATRNMLRNAVLLPPLGIKCVSAEDIIGLKIQAYRNDPRRELQDKADIAAVIRQNPGLDWNKVRMYADLFDEWPAMEKMRETYGL